MNRHAAVADADGFWRQFVVAFYFDTPGDVLAGTILKHWADGPRDDLMPHLQIQTKDGRRYEITVSQERLRSELVKASPAVGDAIRITYTGEAERAAPGMSKAKLFTVEVKRPNPRPPGNGPDAIRGSASENVPVGAGG